MADQATYTSQASASMHLHLGTNTSQDTDDIHEIQHAHVVRTQLRGCQQTCEVKN